MPYVMGSIPFFDCMVRREYTQNLEAGHGDFIPAVAHAVRCVRGHSLWVQVMLMEPYGGCAFLLPIQAITWKPCEPAPDLTYIQPWDCFSSDFGCTELDFVRRGAVNVLPAKVPGQYHCTLDFIGSDLAEHPEQHKSLHIIKMDTGLVGAFPNNRLLWSDPAFWRTVEETPKFKSLAGEFRAEGNQALLRRDPMPAPVVEYVGEKKAKAKPKPSKKPAKPSSKKK